VTTLPKSTVVIALVFGGLLATVVALIPHEGPSPSVPPPPRAWPADASSAPPPGPVQPEPGEISVLSLVNEMADLDHLARLPGVPFVGKQESSYDRRSKRPEDGESWFANDDFITNSASNLVRVEENGAGTKRYVLLDARGPGAVVRLWTATPTGTLRIFIDDDPRPALETSMAALLAGTVPPFERPLGQVTAMGSSLYFPFPFRTRCLIALDTIVSVDPFSGRPMDKVYYQIGYRTYAAEQAAHVRPFSASEVARAAGAIAATATALRENRPLDHATSARRTVALARAAVTTGTSSVTTLEAPPGGGAITTLRLTTPERERARLRATILSIAFDGEETVRAPLVDFFGTGPGWNSYATLPMTVAPDGTLTCRFPMPFKQRAVVTVARDPAADPALPAVPVSGEATIDARPFDADTLLFHARFHPPESLATRPIRDWHIGTLTGRGHQVATVLGVENPPGTMWWGEGDEKLTVDGEAFPSFFGTGTEDYFGYAWSSTETFAHAYHAQTLAPSTGFAGAFSMNRFLVLDPVPFTRSLRFDLELWHWSDTTVTMSALLAWYAGPGARDDFAPR
ncbi:MAG TPA: glycoside hydrolase family 172 protein, partial [Polyangia bacterium]|nr:glycoside hydrolase family 172 protein [Polyangia bacterium]